MNDTLTINYLKLIIGALSFTDGSDDGQIHCFKPGQPRAEGRNMLAEEMKTFVAIDDTSDPFASDDDEEEAENNDACTDACIDEDIDENSETSDEDYYNKQCYS